jgi:hypothetical protein
MQTPGVRRPGSMSAWVVTQNFFKTISELETTFLHLLFDFSHLSPHGSEPAVAALSKDVNVCMRYVAPPSVRMFESMEDDGLAGVGFHVGGGLKSPPGRSNLEIFTICSSFEMNWSVGVYDHRLKYLKLLID